VPAGISAWRQRSKARDGTVGLVMEQLLQLFVTYGPLTLAGALGGVIRWWTARDSWRIAAGNVVAGAITGTYLGPAVSLMIKPVAEFTGMELQDARLLGAHLSGVLGVTLYSFFADIINARTAALKDQLKQEQPK
jgi:hypothetical protein